MAAASLAWEKLFVDPHNTSWADLFGSHRRRAFFTFERDFDAPASFDYIKDKWPIAVVTGAAYCFLVFAGQSVMKDRKRFELRMPLVLWNVALAIFSIVGAIRSMPEFYDHFRISFVDSVCNRDFYTDEVTAFWVFMFCMSKFIELGDTAFIVLRKQHLMFLHWYHHIATLIFCIYFPPRYIPGTMWFLTMNYAVHSVMYSYYALRAMKFRVPHLFAMFITAAQILQMVGGLAVAFKCIHIKYFTNECEVTTLMVVCTSLMYLSYLVLFSMFFYDVYINPKGKFTMVAADKKDGKKVN